MSRKDAREYAYKLVFEYLFNKEKSEITKEIFYEDFSLTDKDKEYINTVYNGVVEKYDELTAKIKQYAKNFEIERMYKSDISVLLLAIYEMLYMEDIPLSVSISEGVEITKKYSTEKSNVYVNGILAS
ncbi:MAG: transcription antitermination factor NusB, partial [Clostridia bacterium]